MERETVYVVVDSWQFDSGENGEVVVVYKNLDDAQKDAISKQKDALNTFKETFPDSYNVHNDINIFQVWESDNYSFNHETITIYKKDIY